MSSTGAVSSSPSVHFEEGTVQQVSSPQGVQQSSGLSQATALSLLRTPSQSTPGAQQGSGLSQATASSLLRNPSQSTPSSSALRPSHGPSRVDTRFLFGFFPDQNDKIVPQALSTVRQLLEEVNRTDSTASLVSWKLADRSSTVAVTLSTFPSNRADFEPYCDSFKARHPAQDKRWYASICINHLASVSAESIKLNLEETISDERWFFIECSIQTDKKTEEIGWFAFSVKEYATPEFRDVLSEALQIPSNHFCLQYKRVRESSDDLWAVVIQAMEGPHLILSTGLSAMYSSKSVGWPWGIRMRFVPYAATLKTKSPAVANLKTLQIKFAKEFKPLPLQNLKVNLDHVFSPTDPLDEDVVISVRDALMQITSPVNGQGVLHGVVEYHDRRYGQRICLIPVPECQVGTLLGHMLAEYPVTIMSHFYPEASIAPLFLTHAVQSEAGTTYDVKTDSIRTPAIAELDACLAQDAKVFSFDLDLVEKDRVKSEKKRKFEGHLVKRIDESSVGTIGAHTNAQAAGSSQRGTRPGN
jgi:hypothetical protein